MMKTKIPVILVLMLLTGNLVNAHSPQYSEKLRLGPQKNFSRVQEESRSGKVGYNRGDERPIGAIATGALDEANNVNYVGITNNLERRAAEHLRSKGITIDGIFGLKEISRMDAKAVEQVLIDFYGLLKKGGNLINKINSISTTNPIYEEAIKRGIELLKTVGYPGF